MAEAIPLAAELRAELDQFRREMRASAEIVKRTGDAMTRDFGRADQAAIGLTTTTRSLTRSMRFFSGAIAGVSLVKFAKDANAAARDMIGLERAFTAIEGSAEGAAETLQFTRRESQRLGLNFRQTARSFRGLSAAAQRTALEGQAIRDVFTDTIEVARVLNLSQEDLSGTFRAFEQTLSKNKLQAEELRLQIGDRLPGAFRLAAKALNVTTAELDKMLELGQVTATEFLPAFARTIRQEFTGAVDDFSVASGRLSTAWDDVLVRLGKFVRESPASVGALDALTGALSKFNEAGERLEGNVPRPEDLSSSRIREIIAEREQQLQTIQDIERGRPSEGFLGSLAGDLGRGLSRIFQRDSEQRKRFLEIEIQTWRTLLEEREEGAKVIADFENAQHNKRVDNIATQAEVITDLATLRKKFGKEALVSELEVFRAEERMAKKRADMAEEARQERLEREQELADEQVRIIQDLTNRQSAIQDQRLREAEQAWEAHQREQTRIAEKAEAERLRDIRQAQEERIREFEGFLGRAENRLADVFQRALQGNLDVLETLRDSAFAILAQMAARFATTQLVMPAAAPFFGAGGGLTGASGALIGGGAGAGLRGTTLVPGRPSPAPSTGLASGTNPFETNASATSGLTVGGAAGAAGAGLGVGLVSEQLLADLGVENNRVRGGASGALGGATTGAMIGTMIAPGIGTLVGAGIGALIGGGLGAGLAGDNERRRPKFQIRDISVAIDDLFEGVIVEIDRKKRDISVDAARSIADTIDAAVTGLLGSVVAQASTLPPEMQESFRGPLEELIDEFTMGLEGVNFDGDTLEKEFQKFVNEDLPKQFAGIFGEISQDIQDAAIKVATSNELTSAIDEQIKNLTEAMMTPAELFEKRMDQIASLQGQLIGAGTEETLRLTRELSQLIGGAFSLAPNAGVLGGDPGRLESTQDMLIRLLEELRATASGNLLAGLPGGGVAPAQAPAAITQGGLNVVINATGDMSARDIANEVIREIEQQSAFGQTTITTR